MWSDDSCYPSFAVVAMRRLSIAIVLNSFKRTITRRCRSRLPAPGSSQAQRPSRRHRRHPRSILYVPEDAVSERRARAAHAFHMKPAEVALLRAGTKCARAQNFSRVDPYFFMFTPPYTPWGRLGARAHLAGLVWGLGPCGLALQSSTPRAGPLADGAGPPPGWPPAPPGPARGRASHPTCAQPGG